MEFSAQEDNLIKRIVKQTNKWNKDNVSRTIAYQNFYKRNPEIRWAFLASMVSRNAGWNMTDLVTKSYQLLLSVKVRNRLFMTYERANWLIFSDAYPQLLLYELSKQYSKPLFHLMPYFKISQFMIREWSQFWVDPNKDRLVKALIINEQNVIEGPVIKQPYFKHNVFWGLPFMTQNLFYMSAVLFPTRTGELFGSYVHGFTHLDKRIHLGKELASMLFLPSLYRRFWSFAKTCQHTGSRMDYERYFHSPIIDSPILRSAYPVITHNDCIRKDWSKDVVIKDNWWEDVEAPLDKDVSQRVYRKWHLLQIGSSIKNLILK